MHPEWEAYDFAALEDHQEHRLDTYMDLLIEIKESFPMKVCCNVWDWRVGYDASVAGPRRRGPG